MDVQIIDLNIPKNINKQISTLLANHHWYKGYDLELNENSRYNDLKQGIRRGFSVETFNGANPININTSLNLFANLVYETTLEKLQISGEIFRFYWNLCLPGDIFDLHTDVDKINHYSIIYNLQTTDGGTIINGHKYQDKESQVKLFQSNILHKGVSPINSQFRMNLNIVFKKY